MVMCIAEDNIFEHHTGFYSCRNPYILVYTFTNLHPITQHLLVFGNEPFTLIGCIYKSP